jgi:hypothetical protein
MSDRASSPSFILRLLSGDLPVVEYSRSF